MASRYRCVVCKQEFSDGNDAKSKPCGPGQGHMLQEMIDGAWNDETRERADFIAADEHDLKRWAEQAKKLGYSIDDN